MRDMHKAADDVSCALLVLWRQPSVANSVGLDVFFTLVGTGRYFAVRQELESMHRDS